MPALLGSRNHAGVCEGFATGTAGWAPQTSHRSPWNPKNSDGREGNRKVTLTKVVDLTFRGDSKIEEGGQRYREGH